MRIQLILHPDQERLSLFDGVLLSPGHFKKSRTCVKTTQNIKMNREIIEITELALANLLDVIPLISNTGERVDPIILRIYERNSAVLEQN